MRILADAMSAQVRATLGRAQTEMPSRLPLRRRRHTLTILSIVVGTGLGILYSHLMIHESRWLVYVLAAIGGSCLVFLVVVIPRLVGAFFRKIWYQVALRQNTDKALVLSGQAHRDLAEQTDGELSPDQRVNDQAVIACLRRDYAGAAGTLGQLLATGSQGWEPANLVVALAETEQWDRLDYLLEKLEEQSQSLSEANLARVAWEAPPGPLLERLQALARERAHARVLNNLGVRALRDGEVQRAWEDLSLALRERPNYALARANLGAIASRQGDLQVALTDMASAAALLPGEAVVCSNLGALLCQAGDLRTAERWLLRAQTLAPRSPAVLLNLGNAYAVQGKYEDALEEYNAAHHLAQTAAPLHNAALVRLAMHDYDDALKAALLAKNLAPHDSDVLNNVGICLWQQGKYQEAEECFREAAALAPGSVAEGNLIVVALREGRTEEVLERLGQDTSQSDEMAFGRGLAYLLTAISIDPKAGATQAKLYDYNLGAADAAFRRVIAAGRSQVTEAWLNLGLINYLSQDYELAADSFINAAKHLGGESDELAYPIAVSYLVAGVQKQEQHGAGPEEPIVPLARELFRKARPYLERAMEVRATSSQAAYNLGVLHYLLGEYDKALALLRKVAVGDAPPYLYNAVGIVESRRAQEMQREVAAAAALGEQRRRQMAAQVNKMLSVAIHYFREVLRVQPHSPIVHANIGLAFMLRNQGDDIETAVHHWNLMRQVGGEWGQRAFDLFTQAMATEEAKRLRFQDIEMAFQQLPVAEWVAFAPPRPTGLKYAVEELPDLPDWQFLAYHPLVKRALSCRAKAEQLKDKLQRLAV